MGENYFPLKMFGLTVPRIVVGEPFSVSQKLRFRNFCAEERGGGGITILSKKVFVSEGRNKNLGSRTLQLPRKFLAWKIFMHK